MYRWVDKRYRAQVYNYGMRMLLEFVVPEPAAFYRAARAGEAVQIDATPPMPFLNDLSPQLPGEPPSRLYGQRHQRVELRPLRGPLRRKRHRAPPPPLFKYIGAALSKDNLDDGKSVAANIEGLRRAGRLRAEHLQRRRLGASGSNYPKFTIQIGGDGYTIINNTSSGNSQLIRQHLGAPTLTPVNGPVPISVAAYDVLAYAVNVQGICARHPEALAAWKLQTYDKISTAYQALQQAYDQKKTQADQAAAGSALTGQNPALNETIEQTELKKLCITMMTGQHFSQFHAVTDPADAPTHFPEVDVSEALNEGPIVEFFEQAFEWEQMTYIFYPYFWTRKSKWVGLEAVSDPDPLFQQFLTAGSARVVVPVPIAYVDAVLYLLQSPAADLRQRVWQGGDPPTLDSPLYVSLAQELRNQTDDLAGATPEGDPWEYTLPTTLVWLQPDGTLPTFP